VNRTIDYTGVELFLLSIFKFLSVFPSLVLPKCNFSSDFDQIILIIQWRYVTSVLQDRAMLSEKIGKKRQARWIHLANANENARLDDCCRRCKLSVWLWHLAGRRGRSFTSTGALISSALTPWWVWRHPVRHSHISSPRSAARTSHLLHLPTCTGCIILLHSVCASSDDCRDQNQQTIVYNTAECAWMIEIRC